MAPPEAEAAEDILLRTDSGGIATLTLNRPAARNALSRALIDALEAALAQIAGDDGTRVVVIAARGKAFCAGHDMRELRAHPAERDIAATFAASSRLMQAIVALARPVIAKVQGTATAAGCQLVASCDLAYGAEDAQFATPGVNIGLFCSTPMVALSRNIGTKQAMEMLLTGAPIDAATAARRGLINRAVPADALNATVDEVARAIAAKSPLTLAIGKAAFYRQRELGLAAAYDYANRVMTDNMATEDAAEGIDAFLDRRAPVWRGR
jgi:enoyl-CoA hydratase/carnithine racemase